jgi:hypothetical protein
MVRLLKLEALEERLVGIVRRGIAVVSLRG